MKICRLILIVLAAAILVQGLPGGDSSASAPGSKKPDSRKAEVLLALRSQQLVEGEFLHDYGDKLTRQELAMVMVKILGKLSSEKIKEIGDVLEPLYPYDDKTLPTPVYRPYILLAGQLGMVEGQSSKKFNPHGLVTRQLFASTLLKAMILARPLNRFYLTEDVRFADIGKINDWAYRGLVYAYKSGTMETNSRNEIMPKGYVTREQALEMMYRILTAENAIVRPTPEEIRRAVGELPLFSVRNQSAQWGFCDANGRMILRATYEKAEEFSEGLAPVYRSGKWGFIDTSGNPVVPPGYSAVRGFHEGMAAVAKGGSFGYIDSTGKVVIKLQYVYDGEFRTGLSDFQSGRALVKTGAGRYRLIDKAGKSITRQSLTAARPFSEGLAAVTLGGKPGYINTSGKLAFSLSPEVIAQGAFHEGFAAVRLGKGWGYIDRKGKVTIKDLPGSAADFSEGLAAVQSGSTYRYIGRSGKWAVKPCFDAAGSFSEGLAPVKVRGRYGYIDKAGTYVIHPLYTKASGFRNGLAVVENDRGAYCLINRRGDVVYSSE